MTDSSASTPGQGPTTPPRPDTRTLPGKAYAEPTYGQPFADAGPASPTTADYPYAPPQQQLGGGYAQPFGGQAAAPARRNGLGTAALVLGIISLLTWLVPFVGVPVTVTCLCLGFAGRGRARRGEADNGGQATAGIVMGFVSLPLIVISGVIGVLAA